MYANVKISVIQLAQSCATPKHVVNVIAGKKGPEGDQQKATTFFPPMITFVTCFGVGKLRQIRAFAIISIRMDTNYVLYDIVEQITRGGGISCNAAETVNDHCVSVSSLRLASDSRHKRSFPTSRA